jgi:hypothetical protein
MSGILYLPNYVICSVQIDSKIYVVIRTNPNLWLMQCLCLKMYFHEPLLIIAIIIDLSVTAE